MNCTRLLVAIAVIVSACFENELLHMWQSESKKDNPHCPVTATETEEDIFPANDLVGLARPGNQVAHESDDKSE
jgi:hypothetical protein